MKKMKKALLSFAFIGALMTGYFGLDSSVAEAANCHGNYSNGMEIVPCK